MWIAFKYITIFVNLFSDFFRCEIVSWYFTIFYEMLHANMMSDITESTFVYFSESTMVSMLRLGTFQNSHCASLPGSISAHVSVGQFLCPVPRLAPQRTPASSHGRHVVSIFDHCGSTLVLGGTFRQKQRYNALAALLALFLLDLPLTGGNDFCPTISWV